MLRSAATLQDIITPTALAFLVPALCMVRDAFLFMKEWAEMACVVKFCNCSTRYGGQTEPENKE